MSPLSLRSQAGSVAVTVAIMLPALLGMGVIVIDIANQWVHKRHLQSQADAAALAGAQLMRAPCDATIDSQIAAEASKYAGASALATGTAGIAPTTFTSQLDVHGGESVLGYLNSPSYPDQPGLVSTSEQNTPGQPCADTAVDVKLTDKSTPFFLANALPFLSGALSSFGHINVHARAAIKQVDVASGLLPYAVTDPTPRQVQARLLSDAGTPLGGTDTTPVTLTATGADQHTFTGTFTGSLPGTRYAAANVQLMTSGSSSPISSDCSGALEQCFPPVGNVAKGLVQSRVWTTAGTTPSGSDVALFYNMQLAPSGVPGCGNDGYFARVTTANCATNVNVSVDANFQSAVTLPTAKAGAKASDHAIVCLGTSTTGWITAPSNGSGPCGKTATQLDYQGPDPANSAQGLWTGSVGGVSTETGNGGATFMSLWAITDQGSVNGTACTNSKPCTSPVTDAQQFFSGTQALSGSLDAVSVVPNSRQPSDCATSCSLTITAHFKPLEPAKTPTDPKFFLRVGDAQHNQTIDCDPTTTTPNLRTQIAQGCPATFRLWTNADPLCNPNPQMSYTYMEGPPLNVSAGPPPGPFPCAQVGPGVAGGQVGQGMAQRIFCGGNPSCTVPNTCPDAYRNHWPTDPAATLPDFTTFNDNRLVPVFIVRYGEFANAPNGKQVYVPVTGFGLFYVTGWTGQGGTGADPCSDITQPLPPGASYDDTSLGDGVVIGHFISQADSSNFFQAGDTNCDFNSITPCVAVLTD